MEYKGYYGKVDFSPEDQVLFGKVAFIPSLISY
jgi:predicted HicB family RNase H-like nuclease